MSRRSCSLLCPDYESATTDPEPESSTKQTSYSLLSRSPLNPALQPRLKYAMDEENVFLRPWRTLNADDSKYKVAYAEILKIRSA